MNRFFTHLLLLICIFFQSEIRAQNIDIDIVKSANEHQSLGKTNFCRFDANSVTFVNLGAPAAVLAVGLIKHDKQLQKDAAYMMGAFLLSAALTRAGKIIVKRNRPYEDYSSITKLSSGGGYSFPSGHTSAAFTTATSLSLYFPKWYVIVPAYLWAGSVGYARIYQGVHYPSDVLAGAVVGAGSAFLTYKAQKWIDRKQKAKKNKPRL
ncbi:MAG: phosphatase PAP2 family protein [Chitinophagaceae bacterium]|nr:phosphatase PAP2 family protein [Chitinophagaceae bacterium]